MISNSILLQAASQNGGGLSGILMIVAMIAIFYLFMIRPQQKKQKELKKQREAMKAGDKVVTTGGIYGRIKEVKDNVVMVDIAPSVTIKVDRGSIFPAVEEQSKKEDTKK